MDIRHRVSAAGSGGSFWQGHLAKSQQPLSRGMAALFHDTALPGMFRSAVAGWSGNTNRVFTMRDIPYHPDMVIVEYGGLNQRVRESPGFTGIIGRAAEAPASTAVIGDGTGMVLSVGGVLTADIETSEGGRDNAPRYYVPVPPGVTVVQLAGRQGLLCAGSHFVSRPGYLEFRDHPDRWLAAPSVLVTIGNEVLPLSADYSLGADTMSGSDVASYYRKNQTTGQLLAASCAAAGLTRVEIGATITGVAEYQDEGACYVTDAGTLDVPYQHQLLEVGTILEAGSYVGAAPAVVNTAGDWWTTASWGTGLDMRTVSPWKLWAPNAQVRAEAVASTGIYPYTRIQLEGDAAELTRWHLACGAAEDASGHWLAPLIGLSLGMVMTVNPLWVFSEFIWSDSALVVSLSAPELSEKMRTRMCSFLQRERPFGRLLIVID
jgi:hypothetical protein